MPVTTNSPSHQDDQISFPWVCAIFDPLLVVCLPLVMCSTPSFSGIPSNLTER